MRLAAAVVGGFTGTLVLTTVLRAASELGLTRMDLAFLLGTAWTGNRSKARMLGFLCHLGLGTAFALVYAAAFAVIHRSSWYLGAAFGLVHAAFVGTVLVNVLLPAVHPRMGTPTSASSEAPLLEAPGFMMLNYGRMTPVVTVVGHALYGAIVGAFISLAG